MRRPLAILLFGLVALSAGRFAFAEGASGEAVAPEVPEDDEYADTERAHLVVRKFIANAINTHLGPDSPISGLVVQGRNVTVTVDIYNAGNTAANRVVLKDTLPVNSTLVEGSVSSEIGKITVGSHVKHSYTVVFTQAKEFQSLPLAVVSYAPDVESPTTQESYSTSYGFYVMTPVQQIQRYALKAGVYASLGFAKTASDWRNLAIVLVLIIGFLSTNWATKHFKKVNVNRKRERALKELEKSD